MKKIIIGTTLSLMVAASVIFEANVQADTVYRLYNRNTGEHFYTKNIHERSSLIQNEWKYGNVSFMSVTLVIITPPVNHVLQAWVKNKAGEII